MMFLTVFVWKQVKSGGQQDRTSLFMMLSWPPQVLPLFLWLPRQVLTLLLWLPKTGTSNAFMTLVLKLILWLPKAGTSNSFKASPGRYFWSFLDLLRQGLLMLSWLPQVGTSKASMDRPPLVCTSRLLKAGKSSAFMTSAAYFLMFSWLPQYSNACMDLIYCSIHFHPLMTSQGSYFQCFHDFPRQFLMLSWPLLSDILSSTFEFQMDRLGILCYVRGMLGNNCTGWPNLKLFILIKRDTCVR